MEEQEEEGQGQEEGQEGQGLHYFYCSVASRDGITRCYRGFVNVVTI